MLMQQVKAQRRCLKRRLFKRPAREHVESEVGRSGLIGHDVEQCHHSWRIDANFLRHEIVAEAVALYLALAGRLAMAATAFVMMLAAFRRLRDSDLREL